ncbi:single-stranded-DNA-specific exonuclease RecJ [Phormidium tenue FACHB-886]|nr:single-stranded-DNA-specific exonuclease RecJ [Phormidium tenue FACHB-886]
MTGLSPLLTQVLINRGVEDAEAAQLFLKPESQVLPSPLEEFPDLPIALELLLNALMHRQPIAICGDYDADGMTSTALLLRSLRFLGAIVDYAIPSRMQEGYGINQRIVEEFYEEGVQLILTVDNGITAVEPIARARELGLTVIVTDHHDIPPVLPPANAILNPKLIREDSPYCGVAGVGVAYILAVCLAQCLGKTQDLTTPLIELFTLGTIADLAPLTGVNRRWVRRGLGLLPKSRLAGIQALIQVAGLSNERALKPEAIGFRLGPRINAIGRISDPQIVIELLTTDDDGQALELAMKCEQVNQCRQRMCELIEQEAIAYCTESQFDSQQERVLVIVQPEWHHGVIGIVASRLVERYGVPVFIGTYEADETESGAAKALIRGSARGIPEFNVFEALQFAGDLLKKFGGHKAAGGFTLAAEHLEAFRLRLRTYAHQTLSPDCLKPLVTIDAQAELTDLTFDLFRQIDKLHPCGIENADPVFWTPNVQVREQQPIGRNQAHLKLTVEQDTQGLVTSFKALAWRWGEYYPLPRAIDIAYRLRLNEWNGVQSVELELVGVRPAQAQAQFPDRIPALNGSRSATALPAPPPFSTSVSPTLPNQTAESPPQKSFVSAPEKPTEPAPMPPKLEEIESAPTNTRTEVTSSVAALSIDLAPPDEALPDDRFSLDAELEAAPAIAKVEFFHSKRKYICSIHKLESTRELRIRNLEGQVLSIQPQQQQGYLGKQRATAQAVDLSQPRYFNLVRAALCALHLAEKAQRLQTQAQLLLEKDQHIALLTQQIALLQEQLSQQDIALQSPTLSNLQRDLLEKEGAIATYETQIAALAATELAAKPPTKPEEVRRYLKAELGEAIWNALSQSSQRDLTAAYKTLFTIQADAFTASVVDYSEAGSRLGMVPEREIVQLFFKQIHQFLQSHSKTAIGGIALKARKKYSLEMLPPLLAAEWHWLEATVLESQSLVPEPHCYCPMTTDQVSELDRQLITTFLEQWQHPIAPWFLHHSSTAASALAQISQLRAVAVSSDRLLYDWQFERLQSLIIGNLEEPGILRTLYNIQL